MKALLLAAAALGFVGALEAFPNKIYRLANSNSADIKPLNILSTPQQHGQIQSLKQHAKGTTQEQTQHDKLDGLTPQGFAELIAKFKAGKKPIINAAKNATLKTSNFGKALRLFPGKQEQLEREDSQNIQSQPKVKTRLASTFKTRNGVCDSKSDLNRTQQVDQNQNDQAS